MKLPIIPTSLSLILLFIATALVVSRTHTEPSAPDGQPVLASVVTKKPQRTVRKPARLESESPPIRESISRVAQTVPDESANLTAWVQQFQALLASGESQENAAINIARNVDKAFSEWVETEIAASAALTGQERIDRLTLAETQVKEGAALIYEQLDLVGGRRIEVAADAIDSLAAELQYADAAPDHATRLAMLRLIREHDLRMDEASAMTDESAKTHAMRELDTWYERGMGELNTVKPSDH